MLKGKKLFVARVKQVLREYGDGRDADSCMVDIQKEMNALCAHSVHVKSERD